MPRRGYTPEQIIGKLREVDVLVHQGHTIGEAVRKIGRLITPTRCLSEVLAPSQAVPRMALSLPPFVIRQIAVHGQSSW